jgi:hypothetical protein
MIMQKHVNHLTAEFVLTLKKLFTSSQSYDDERKMKNISRCLMDFFVNSFSRKVNAHLLVLYYQGWVFLLPYFHHFKNELS